MAAKTKLAKEDKVLPGIEPGFRDSESPVITVTLQDPLRRSVNAWGLCGAGVQAALTVWRGDRAWAQPSEPQWPNG